MKTITQNFRKMAVFVLLAVSLTSTSYVCAQTEITFTDWTSGTLLSSTQYPVDQSIRDLVTKITVSSSSILLDNADIFTIASTSNFPNLEVVDLSGVQAVVTTFPKAWGKGTSGVATVGETIPKLKSISLPPNVTTTEKDAFAFCSNLETVVFPTNLTSISSYGFYGCSKLVNINLQNTSLTTVGGSAFYNCTALKEVHMPNTVTAFGGNVFRGSSSLETLTFPANVTDSILNGSNTNSFTGCPLKKVICKATAVPRAAQMFIPANLIGSGCKLYVLSSLVEAYRSSLSNCWSKFTDANIVSIDELTKGINVTPESKSVVVYPNHEKSNFTIRNQEDIASVEVLSLGGQPLKSFIQQSSYSVADLKSGCYFVRINSKSNPQTVKIVVE